MENTKKWSEEFIMRNDVTDKNNLLFIKEKLTNLYHYYLQYIN
jgi:hypothetical protein